MTSKTADICLLSNLKHRRMMEEYESTSDLSLSCESSAFGSIQEDISELEESLRDIQPYQFEPNASENSEDEDDNSSTQNGNMEDRLQNTDWCTCGHCQVMPTGEECICCQEISRITDKLEELQAEPICHCITDHPGFFPVCLNPYVLETAYFQYRQQYGEIQVNNEERNRYTAYRQLARWCWGYLGKSVRVRLPACATLAIRRTFPSEQFRGFEEV